MIQIGDRRNIVIEQAEADLVLYTHWGGTELPVTLQDALIRGGSRVDDTAYLSRIVFSEMIKQDVDGLTGFGIEAVAHGSTNYCEASSRDIILNPALQSIRCRGGGAWTVVEYVNLTKDQLLRIGQ